jgi:hypothetical protein
LVFLVKLSMADSDGNLARMSARISVDAKGVTNYFSKRGLDKFSTGEAVRGEDVMDDGVRQPGNMKMAGEEARVWTPARQPVKETGAICAEETARTVGMTRCKREKRVIFRGDSPLRSECWCGRKKSGAAIEAAPLFDLGIGWSGSL